jgi:omega-amidase
MKFVLVSLNQIWENKEANKKRILKILERLKSTDLDFIILSEMTLTGYSMNAEKIAEENYETLNWFKRLARDFKTNFIFGVSVKIKHHYRNKDYVVSKNGNLLSDYSKIHLFSLSEEHKYYTFGNELAYFIYNKISIGLTIYYDLRFLEIYQALSKNCDVIINIANWPSIRKAHWITLLKARAIENQVYMIGVNTRGNVIAPIRKSKEIDIYDIDTSIVQKTREIFRLKTDRKEELYEKCYKALRK